MPHPTYPAPSAAPSNAIPVWTDGLSLFTELPGPNGLPVVLRYPLTSTGLTSALGLIRTRAYDCHDRSPTALAPPSTTAHRQASAREFLRKVGIAP